jgi:hypothetical protein
MGDDLVDRLPQHQELAPWTPRSAQAVGLIEHGPQACQLRTGADGVVEVLGQVRLSRLPPCSSSTAGLRYAPAVRRGHRGCTGELPRRRALCATGRGKPPREAVSRWQRMSSWCGTRSRST